MQNMHHIFLSEALHTPNILHSGFWSDYVFIPTTFAVALSCLLKTHMKIN